jgi:hypothetical protein
MKSTCIVSGNSIHLTAGAQAVFQQWPCSSNASAWASHCVWQWAPDFLLKNITEYTPLCCNLNDKKKISRLKHNLHSFTSLATCFGFKSVHHQTNKKTNSRYVYIVTTGQHTALPLRFFCEIPHHHYNKTVTVKGTLIWLKFIKKHYR